MNQWLTMSEAARACGRKPGGNIGRLMNKWGVRWTIYKGNKGYLKDDVSRVPHLHRTATAQAANELIDRETKGQAELPLTVKPTVKPVEKSDAEKLDGVTAGDFTVKGRESIDCVILELAGGYVVGMKVATIIALSREIVRRIDGEPVKPEESKPTESWIEFARYVVTHADGCDYRAKYQELVKRLNEIKEG